MVKVGLVGLGFMGLTHYRGWREIAGSGLAELTALCEMDEQRLRGDWSNIQGNIGEGGGIEDVSDLGQYTQIEEMLKDDRINLVDICLPTKFHADSAVKALEAGKHVICEKPIALEVADADRMIAAAKASGVQFMVAQVIRFWPQYQWLKEAVASGRYGTLNAVNFRRVITLPTWSPAMANLAAIGGPLKDLHIHDVDYVLHLLGKPAKIMASGQDMGDYIKYVAASFIYPGGPVVSLQGGVCTTAGRGFQHTFEAYFENATVAFSEAADPACADAAQNQTSTQVLTVYLPDGTAEFPEAPGEAGYTAELRHAAECVANGQPTTVIGADTARDALAMTDLEAQSIRSGQAVDVA